MAAKRVINTKKIERTIASWAELQEVLFDGSFNGKINRFRSNFAYRGLNNSNYKLENGLIRLGKPYDNMERNILRQFQKYAHKHLVEKNTEWHWLSIAQHHGLPTRLLDWTYSPFVAMHFATSNTSEFSVDSAIWRVDFAQVHSLLQDKHRTILTETGGNSFSVDTLGKAITDLNALTAEHSSNFDIAVFFEPPAMDDRIINQFAYFSMLSDPTLAMDDWLTRPSVSKAVDVTKIIIPSSLKWEIRDKLDSSNINERVLFPGLDGLCAWLRRHYMPI